MEAKELRIGNYIIQGGLVTIVEQLETSVNDWDRTNHKRTIDCQPIPLTEEWLIKFGFVKEEINKGNKIEFGYYKNDFIMLRFQDSDHWYACPKGYPFVFPERSLYAHQLQNLYLSMTGEELTIIIKE